MVTQLRVNCIILKVQGVAEHAPLRVSEVEMLFPTFITWRAVRQNVQDPVAQGRVETQGLRLDDELGGYYGVEC